MKRIVSIFVALTLMLSSAYAQGIVKDFFKSQNKKGVKTDSLRASLDTIPYITPEGQVISNGDLDIKMDSAQLESVMNSVFILHQDYCLYDKKKKKYYGYDDNEMFGTSVNFSIKCKDFNLLFDSSVRPWEYDDKYPEFKAKNLEPYVTASKYLFVRDSIVEQLITLDSIVQPIKTIKAGLVYASKPFANQNEGLVINNADTCKAGVIVWVVKETKDNGSVCNISLEQTVFKGNMLGTTTVSCPVKGKDIMGGFYLTFSEESNMPYLNGVVTLKEENWQLSFPFKGFKFTEEKKEQKPKLGRLTEIKKK